MWKDTTTLPKSYSRVIMAVGEDGGDDVQRIAVGMHVDNHGWREEDGSTTHIPVDGIVYFWMEIPPVPEISR